MIVWDGMITICKLAFFSCLVLIFYKVNIDSEFGRLHISWSWFLKNMLFRRVPILAFEFQRAKMWRNIRFYRINLALRTRCQIRPIIP